MVPYLILLEGNIRRKEEQEDKDEDEKEEEETEEGETRHETTKKNWDKRKKGKEEMGLKLKSHESFLPFLQHQNGYDCCFSMAGYLWCKHCTHDALWDSDMPPLWKHLHAT